MKGNQPEKSFSHYAYIFLTENPEYAKSFVETLCQSFKLVCYGVILAIIIFAIFSAKYLFAS